MLESIQILILLLSGQIYFLFLFYFFFFFEFKHVQTSRFIDDLSIINDDGKFSKSCKCIYLRELELKLEHSRTRATFLDLAIKIEDRIFFYKLFGKRDKFIFFIVRMPHIESNIPSTIFYDSIFSEFLRIARFTLKLEHFLPTSLELYSRMLSQGANQKCINKEIVKGFPRYPNVLRKYCKNYNKLFQELQNYFSSKLLRSNKYFLSIRLVIENVFITKNLISKGYKNCIESKSPKQCRVLLIK